MGLPVPEAVAGQARSEAGLEALEEKKLGDAWRGVAWRGELGFLVEAFAEAAAAIGGEKGNGAEQRMGAAGAGWFVNADWAPPFGLVSWRP